MANFWTQPSRDPKRNFKFLVSFPTMDGGMAWYAKKVDKPSFTVNEASHKYLNHTFYYSFNLIKGIIFNFNPP